MRHKILTLILVCLLVTVGLPASALAQVSCGTAPPPRLQLGQSASILVADGASNDLRASPNSGAALVNVLENGEVFSVIAGPQCAENFWWWQVRRWDGETGWLAETATSNYWVEPWAATTSQIPDGPKPNLPGVFLAFYSGYEGYIIPHTMQVNGVDLQSLGTVPGFDERLVWSPDGTRVVFSDGHDIWRSDPSGLQNVTNNPEGANSWPTWSPDSMRIAFVSERDGNREIYVYDGLSMHNLTDHPAHDGWPAWSPDGTQIAFASDRDGNLEIYSMNATDGSNPVRHTVNMAEDTAPVWSPDGTQIAFLSAADGFSDIYVLTEQNNTVAAVTDKGNNRSPVWSPDGTQIAYVGESPIGSGQEEIFSIRSDGTQPVQYTANGGQAAGVSWSPGGMWLAFADNSSGNFDIYAIQKNGQGLVRLINNPGVDKFPVFQPLTTPNMPDESLSVVTVPTPGPLPLNPTVSGPVPIPITPFPTFVPPPTPKPSPTMNVVNPGTQDLLLIYDANVAVFTLQNISGRWINLEQLSFSGGGVTVPASIWSAYTASPLNNFKPRGCLMIWTYGIPDPPVPSECQSARQGWVTRNAYIFWTQGNFTVTYQGGVVATCPTAAGRCYVDLP